MDALDRHTAVAQRLGDPLIGPCSRAVAIDTARCVIETADVLIALREPRQGFAELQGVGSEQDIFVMNKIDEPGPIKPTGTGTPHHPIPISAVHQLGLEVLGDGVLTCLKLTTTLSYA